MHAMRRSPLLLLPALAPLVLGDWAPRKLLIADVRNPLDLVIIGEASLDGYGGGGC